MRPDERDINDELRGHLALSIKERIERGEDPASARRAALNELGYIPDVRDSVRRVWYSRWFDATAALAREMRIGLRSLLRTKGLAVTVVVTLALGIGANAAIFSVVRGVLLRPLVNRGEDRLVYIRQSAPGVGTENMTFSVPEFNDVKARATTIAAFGDFSTILARSVRREGELAVRAALGASHGALRRTLLAESLVLCGAGAILGVVLAQPFVSVVARYAARFSVRALEVTVDDTVVWVGAGLAIAAAVLLAYVPRLPSSNAPAGFGLAGGSLRITPGTNRRLRVFATTQIAFSFVLLAGAGMLVAALIALQTANTGFLTRQVLAVDIPPLSVESSSPSTRTAATSAPASNPPPGPQEQAPDLYREVTQRVGQLPGVDGVVGGLFVPWRDTGRWPHIQFTVEGYTPADGEDNPPARQRTVGPGFFAMLGIPVVAGREFTEDDRTGSERVVIVSQSVAQRLFPNGDALNRKLWRTSALSASAAVNPTPSRIVGVVADVDDENVRAPAMAVYTPYRGKSLPMRMFVRTSGDAYALVPPVTRIIRDLSANQAVERPATLEDVRAEVLTPERLNAFVVSGFAGIALLIAVVGVSGVLAFSVSARTREFGVRLAVGSAPRHLLLRVLSEGASIAAVGIAAGAACAYVFAGVAGSYLENVRFPGVLPVLAAASILAVAAAVASLMPAVRASRVDVLQALRSE